MSTVLPSTYKTQDALEHLSKTERVQFRVINGGDEYYIVRFYAWGKTHNGTQTTSVNGTQVEWLREGVIIELLDNGLRIYQETRQGTAGDITLTNAIATQANIETAIKMALEGIK